MVFRPEASLQRLLLDPDFWRPRLERLRGAPRELVLCPRPDLARAGIEVLELRLRAHDGARLRALLGRPAFCQEGDHVHVRPCPEPAPELLDWDAVQHGATDLIFAYPSEGRRLEDRVLDVLQLTSAACSIESVPCTRITFEAPEDDGQADELAIVRLIQQAGWI